MQNPSEFGGLVGAVWRHRAMVVVAVLVSTVAGYYVATMLPPVYRASATMYLSNAGYDGVFGAALPMGATDWYPDAASRVLRSDTFRQDVVEVVGGGLTLDELDDAVTAMAVPDSDTVRIDAEHADPATAATVANAMVTTYQDVMAAERAERVAAAARELNAYAAELTERLEGLDAIGDQGEAVAGGDEVLSNQRLAIAQEIEEVRAAVERLQVDNDVVGAGLYRFEAADVPDDPVRPRPVIVALVAGLAGLVVAAAVSWWRSEQARRRSHPTIEEVLQAAPLGVFSRPAGNGRGTLPPPPVESQYRVIAKLLHDSGRGRRVVPSGRAVLVTAAVPGLPAAEVAHSIATASVQSRRRTVMVHDDRGRRDLGDVVVASSGVDVVPYDMDAVRGEEDPRPTLPRDGLLVLQPGPRRDAVDAARAFTARLAGAKPELVVIEASPLLGGTRAIRLASRVDGVVLVVPEVWPPGVFKQLDDLMQTVPVPVVGYITVASAHELVPPVSDVVVRSNGAQTVSPSVLREEVAR